jgi:hypothetical protein
MASPEVRAFDGSGSKVTTRLNTSGDLIITISAGPVSICATVPQQQLPFLTFAERMQAQDQAA